MTIETAIAAAVRAAIAAALPGAVREALGTVQPVAVLPRYLTTEEAAQVAGVTAETIREWSASGRLPRHKAGRHVRVRLDELEAFMRRDIAPRSSDDDIDAQAAEIVGRFGAMR